MRRLRALTLAALLLSAPLVTAATPHRGHPPKEREGIIDLLVKSWESLIEAFDVLSIPHG